MAKGKSQQRTKQKAAAAEAEKIAVEPQVAVVMNTMVMDIVANVSTPRSEASTVLSLIHI